jgi:hypothetical protein
MRICKAHYLGIILGGRAKLSGELLHREEFMIVGTRWIIELPDQRLQLLLIAQGKRKSKPQLL